MTIDWPSMAPRPGSRRAIIGFWLWAGSVILFVVGVTLGIALEDALPSQMGISASLNFPFAAGFIAIPVSTVGLGFAIASLKKREPRRRLAVATVVGWVLPIVALIVLRVILSATNA
jgi:Na+/H+-dicarboxylate symporter